MTTPTWPVHVATAGPIRATTRLWRLGGRPHLTLVIKASFAFVPEGEGRLEAPDPFGEGDLSPYLPAADVTVLGAGRGPCRLLVAGEHSLVDKAISAGGGPAGLAPEPAPDRALLAASGADLPQGFDWTRLHAAPPDQRAPFLQGNEWIVLEGLVPASPLLRTRLPDLGVTAQLHGLGAPVHVKLRLDTLAIDATAGRFTLLWRGFLALPREVAPGELHASAALTLAGRAVEAAPLAEPANDRRQATPPRSSPSSPGGAIPGAPWSRDSAPALVDPTMFDGTLDLSSFRASQGEHDLEGTVAGARPSSSPALPFPAGAPRSVPSPSPGLPGAPWAAEAAAKPPSAASFDGTLDLTAAMARNRKVEPPAPPPLEAPRVVEAPRVMEAPRVEERVEAPRAPPPPDPPRPAMAPRKSATGTLYTGFGPRKK